MRIQKHSHIPHRVIQVDTTLTWGRLARQCYWLSDGKRDTQKIALLLHRSPAAIREALVQLELNGYITIYHERKLLTMNPALLRESFNLISPQERDAFAARFYETLFQDYPQVIPLFAKTDMPRLRSSLMATLASVIAGVERGENLLPVLHALGQKHIQYGVKPEYYPYVGASLLDTFHLFLGFRFTLAMQHAWDDALEVISEAMQK